MEEGRVAGSNAGPASVCSFQPLQKTRSATQKINNVGSRISTGRKVNTQVTFPKQ